MKTTELMKKLKGAGCYFDSHGTNHDWWYSPVTGIKFQIPRHGSKEIKDQLKKSIEKQSGVKL